MRIDVHFHVIGNGTDLNNVDNDVYFYADDNNHWFTRILYNMIEEDIERQGADFNQDGKFSTEEYFDYVYRILISSKEIDGIVLLGLDAVYDLSTGVIDEKKTDLYVSNTYLNKKVTKLNERLQNETDPQIRNKKFFMGASVNPNRKDWESELDYVLSDTKAVLIKWIPSTQHIHIEDDKHENFYNVPSNNNMPLLCHVGPEYSFPEGIRRKELDNFRFLEKPLEHGVTIIAAHCATPVFPLIDKNEIKEFHALMKNANQGGNIRLWADTSALSLSTRIPIIPEIVKTFPPKWLIHGSDFPIPIDAWPHLPWITEDMTPEEYIQIIKTKNPLDRDVRTKHAHGFSSKIHANAEKVLRISVT
jgi:predicted TIM-barrel fold metal-dependent hydrolase